MLTSAFKVHGRVSLETILKPSYSIGGFEWIFFSLLTSAAFSLQTSENNLKPP